MKIYQNGLTRERQTEREREKVERIERKKKDVRIWRSRERKRNIRKGHNVQFKNEKVTRQNTKIATCLFHSIDSLYPIK